MKYQFILQDENIMRFTSNQQSIPCFKRLNDVKVFPELSLAVTCRTGFFNLLYVVVNVSHRNCTHL